MEPTKEELKTINRVAKVLSPLFTFSYYDKDDIEQETKLFCLQILDKFNPSKGSLYTFLFISCRTYLMNIRRQQYTKNCHPCDKCEYNNMGCTKYSNQLECEKCRKTILNNERKYDLANVYPTLDNISYNIDFEKLIDDAELYNTIDKNIPANIRHNYKKFLDGVSLSYYDKKIVVDTIKQIAIEKGYISGEV